MATRTPAHTAGSQRCVAIDLGPRYVRVVEVEQSGAEAHIVRRGTAALPPNVWNDTGANRDTLAAAIREALAAAGITTRAVAACLPRRLVTVRFARLPHAPPDQIRGMIEFEAQQYILFPLNEVMLDYHVQSGLDAGLGSNDDMQTVLLAAARRSLVADVVAVFDQAGLELQQLSVSALALAEHARDSLEPTALISLDSGAMDVAVVADGQLLYTRSSALDLTGIDPEVAARKFGEEVARSFTAYQNEFRQKPLSHVYICGGEMAHDGGAWMERVLTDSLEMSVSPLHSRLIPSNDPEARTYAVAAGVALEGLGANLAGVNLVPNDRAERRIQQRKRSQQQLIGIGVVAVVGAGLYLFRSALTSQDQRRKETIIANQEMDDAQKREKPIKTRHDRVTAMDQVLTKELDRAHPSVDILVALNRALPKSSEIWLTQMNFDRSSVLTLRGESKSSNAVTELLLNLQASGAFTDVKLGLLADAQDNTASASETLRTPARTAEVVTPLPGMPANGAPGSSAVAQNSSPNPQGGFNGSRSAAMPAGMVPGGSPGSPPQFPGGNPAAVTPGVNAPSPAGFPGGAVPPGFPGGAPPAIPSSVPAPGPGFPGAPPNNPTGGANNPGGGRMVVITPDMAARSGVAGNPAGSFSNPNGSFGNPAGSAGDGNGGGFGFGGRRRRQGNGVTFMPGQSSVSMSQPGGTTAPPVLTAPASVSPPKPVTVTRRPRATTAFDKSPKTVLTSFVITCRLKPNAILLRPEVKETAQVRPAPPRERPVVRTTDSSTEADTSGDTGDDIE